MRNQIGFTIAAASFFLAVGFWIIRLMQAPLW
jgi:hypothetical protein